MRERHSDMHKPVNIRKKAFTQPNFDPIMKEYIGETVMPEYQVVNYLALVDENGKHKEKWIHEL
jgi:hypothetical protein